MSEAMIKLNSSDSIGSFRASPGDTAEQDGEELEYAVASESLAEGDLVTIKQGTVGGIVYDAVASKVATGQPTEPLKAGRIGFTMATGEAGWIWRKWRNRTVQTDGPVSAGVKVYNSTTVGKVDDTSASKTCIQGLVAPSAIAGAQLGVFNAIRPLTLNCET